MAWALWRWSFEIEMIWWIQALHGISGKLGDAPRFFRVRLRFCDVSNGFVFWEERQDDAVVVIDEIGIRLVDDVGGHGVGVGVSNVGMYQIRYGIVVNPEDVVINLDVHCVWFMHVLPCHSPVAMSPASCAILMRRDIVLRVARFRVDGLAKPIEVGLIFGVGNEVYLVKVATVAGKVASKVAVEDVNILPSAVCGFVLVSTLKTHSNSRD